MTNYAHPAGPPAPIRPGSCISVSPGYVTPEGNQVSPGLTFTIEGYAIVSQEGKARFILTACDGLKSLQDWKARHQFRWNSHVPASTVKTILTFILARVGLRLQVISESSQITSLMPDFAVSPGQAGLDVVGSLLGMVPDHLFIEGSVAYLVNPLPGDAATYSFGPGHPYHSLVYGVQAYGPNFFEVEGYDPATLSPILVHSVDWSEVSAMYDRVQYIRDRNLTTPQMVADRGTAELRRQAIAAGPATLTAPPHCGLQALDVVEVTDVRTGLAARRFRVLGYTLSYVPENAVYQQKITLGAP